MISQAVLSRLVCGGCVLEGSRSSQPPPAGNLAVDTRTVAVPYLDRSGHRTSGDSHPEGLLGRSGGLADDRHWHSFRAADWGNASGDGSAVGVSSQSTAGVVSAASGWRGSAESGEAGLLRRKPRGCRNLALIGPRGAAFCRWRNGSAGDGDWSFARAEAGMVATGGSRSGQIGVPGGHCGLAWA